MIAVALIAASIGDIVVESIANAGFAGGHYCDNNHTTVLPALLAGGIFVVATLLLRCRSAFCSSVGSGDWLAEAARSFSERSPSRDLPYVFCTQMLALLGMESAEQLAGDGHLLGGTVWLGGPVLFSLLAHALIGAACSYALGSFMRALLRTLASLCAVLRAIWLALVRTATPMGCARELPPSLQHQWDAVRYSCGRAPPLLHTPA